jgi:MoaA/NifB/PqqE/SkfB family radical SAM enzyme
MVTQAPVYQRLRMGVCYLPYFSFNGMRYFLSWLKNEKIHMFDGKLRINSFVPPWPSIAHQRLLKAAFSDNRIPFQAYYAVTGNCPCHCLHCSYAKRNKDELSESQSLTLIDQIKQLGCSILGFTGGEPLLRKDLEIMIAACKPELATILFTTGHGLTQNRAEQLKQAQLDWFTVGFESANEKIHDSVRNHQGSFKIGLQALQKASKAGLYTAISTVATKYKVKNGEIEQLYDFATDHNVKELRIIPYIATGRGVGNTNHMLGSSEYEFLTSFHKSMNKKNHGPVVESFSYIESAELFGCGAGYHHFFIDASGNVYPCDLTPFSFGSITNESLQVIWKKMNTCFPRPRSYCIMKKIAPALSKITSLPIIYKENTKHLLSLTDDDSWPIMYTFLKKKD